MLMNYVEFNISAFVCFCISFFLLFGDNEWITMKINDII